MNQLSFRVYLKRYNLDDAIMDQSLAISRRFEAFLNEPGQHSSVESAWAFSKQLISSHENTWDHYVALIRYCRFSGYDRLFEALMETVDGSEVAENLYRAIGERFGPALQTDVYQGIGIPALGTPSPEKPVHIHPVIDRLENRMGRESCGKLLSGCLRDLPDEAYRGDRELFARADGIDAYLQMKRDQFLTELEACHREDRPFFTQRVTPRVIEFVRSEPEIGAGVRQGDVIFETKIPYQTDRYLEASDPTRKRYCACHCPWSRDAILDSSTRLMERFCFCSGGFHKRHLEILTNRSLEVDVVESVLRGDMRCRFAIHLPMDLR